MKFSTITLALVSGMASIASAERPKSNGRIINPMINDSSKPMSAVEEQGQRHLQGKSSKSTSSTKSGKSKSSKSAGPCDMLGMGCTITAAASAGLGNACDARPTATPPFLGVDANTVGEFQCNTGQPFGEGTLEVSFSMRTLTLMGKDLDASVLAIVVKMLIIKA